ncbi:MAG TPA: hypothetical protein EYG66_06525 [Mariprofundaceae bacterium]|nr:hypothetical protein [Mariprofundaceae bacterium]
MQRKMHGDAKRNIVDYIEMFYNSCRAHSYLDYLSPNEYESVQQALPQASIPRPLHKIAVWNAVISSFPLFTIHRSMSKCCFYISSWRGNVRRRKTDAATAAMEYCQYIARQDGCR